MPLHGLVHDSPVITAIQKTTGKGSNQQAVRTLEETEAVLYACRRLFLGIARMFNIPIK